MIRCTSCETDFAEDILYPSWYDFYEHCYKLHPNQRELVRSLPLNISGRTKKEIVRMAEEYYLKPYII